LFTRIHRVYRGVFCSLMLLVGTLSAQTAKGGEGALLFSQSCSGCHGSDGRGGEHAPNIATRHEVVAVSDAQLKNIVSKGIAAAGMPSFAQLGNEKVSQLVAYLRVLQGVGDTAHVELPGDPAAGEALYIGKASCSGCHMVRGKGGFLGEDLSDYARGRAVDAIRAAIVSPENGPESRGHLTSIALSDGTKYEGLVRAENNFNVVLQTKDGAFHSIARDRIATLDTGRQSLMPQDYGKTLTPEELNDVMSYLMKSASLMGPPPASKHHDDDDDDEDQ
jgi:cytochrome c oxidase cbb3-type subunit 3